MNEQMHLDGPVMVKGVVMRHWIVIRLSKNCISNPPLRPPAGGRGLYTTAAEDKSHIEGRAPCKR